MDANAHFVGEPGFWSSGLGLDRLFVKPFLACVPVMVDSDGSAEYFPSDEETTLDMLGMSDDKRVVEITRLSDVLDYEEHAMSAEIPFGRWPDRKE